MQQKKTQTKIQKSTETQKVMFLHKTASRSFGFGGMFSVFSAILCNFNIFTSLILIFHQKYVEFLGQCVSFFEICTLFKIYLRYILGFKHLL